MIVETAPAKINLYLHVGPVRDDGLHELASLFVFTEDGDKVTVTPAADISLAIEGPFGGSLSTLPPEDNLVWRAAVLLKKSAGIETGAEILLEKNLPVAAGIGGGSADAAAALRALVRLWGCDISAEALARLAFTLGADVPACLARAPVYVTGAGEHIAPAPALPPLWVCLVNPGVDMPTGPVFRAFDGARSSPPPPEIPALDTRNYETLIVSLAQTRNDLEPAARVLAPEITSVIDWLAATPGALLTRMSGSGATVFSLFSSSSDAMRAKAGAQSQGWWALASPLCMR